MTKSPEYQSQLKALQRELVLLQQHVVKNNKRLLIIFEGRDAAGKGGAIRHFTRHLNPRAMRVIALPKPTDKEAGQWFFQRYFLGLPNPGEIIFFDRSWYNRAVVEPVMGFCTTEQYDEFMGQVNNIEKMLIDDGIQIIKFWFSIDRTAQQSRFESRKSDVLKQWKLSTVDALAQEKWDEFTYFKEKMFEQTHTLNSPWIIVNGNNKPKARLESIRYVLSQCDYEGKGQIDTRLHPDSHLVRPYDLEYLEAKRESDKI